MNEPLKPITDRLLVFPGGEEPITAPTRDAVPGGPTMQRGRAPGVEHLAGDRASAPPKSFTVNGVSYPTANALADPALVRAAGGLDIPPRDLEKFMVAGPHAFDQRAVLAQPGALRSWLLRTSIWYTFAIGDGKKATLDGDHFVELTVDRPGRRAVLKPFMLINNGNGSGHCGHTDLYLGKFRPLGDSFASFPDVSAQDAQARAKAMHPDAVAFLDGNKRWQAWVSDEVHGTPMVGHAMATKKTGRNFLQRIGDRIEAIREGFPFTGVFVEPMKDFFDRFARGDYYIVNDDRMTPEMARRGLDAFLGIQGKKYDSHLNLSDDAFYCSEAVVEFFRGAYEGSGKKPPYLPTSRVQQHLGPIKGLDEIIAEPMSFAASPHLRFVHGNASGTRDYIDVRQKLVLPARI